MPNLISLFLLGENAVPMDKWIAAKRKQQHEQHQAGIVLLREAPNGWVPHHAPQLLDRSNVDRPRNDSIQKVVQCGTLHALRTSPTVATAVMVTLYYLLLFFIKPVVGHSSHDRRRIRGKDESVVTHEVKGDDRFIRLIRLLRKF
jgi:hypothetical protein